MIKIKKCSFNSNLSMNFSSLLYIIKLKKLLLFTDEFFIGNSLVQYDGNIYQRFTDRIINHWKIHKLIIYSIIH